MQKYDNTFIKFIWCYSGFCDILSLNVKMYLWLKLYTVPFFVSGQTYKISKGSNNYCSHCKWCMDIYPCYCEGCVWIYQSREQGIYPLYGTRGFRWSYPSLGWTEWDSTCRATSVYFSLKKLQNPNKNEMARYKSKTTTILNLNVSQWLLCSKFTSILVRWNSLRICKSKCCINSSKPIAKYLKTYMRFANPSIPIPRKSVLGSSPWKPISPHCLVILDSSFAEGISKSHSCLNKKLLTHRLPVGRQKALWILILSTNLNTSL